MRYLSFLALLTASLISCSGTTGSTKAATPPPKTQITSAKVQGSNLLIAANIFGPNTVATLGGVSLKVASAKTNELVAALPEPVVPGTYLLYVSGGTPQTTDFFTVTIGASGPPGPPGLPGMSSPPFPSGYSILGDSAMPPGIARVAKPAVGKLF